MGCDQIKPGDFYLKEATVKFAQHLIRTCHGTHVAFQVASRHIFVLFSGFDDGLYAYNPLSFHFPVGTVGVEDIPMAPQKLYAVVAQIFNGNPIRKHVVFVFRIGILRLIDCFNRNFYPVCDLRGHVCKRNLWANLINVFELKKSYPANFLRGAFICIFASLLRIPFATFVSMPYGTLYLIPVPLADDAAAASYTPYLIQVVNAIDEYIVENEKTARKFLKQAGIQRPQSELILHDYGKHARNSGSVADYFGGLLKGKNVGLMSEAGCPGIADPGADIVAEAHRRGIPVAPLVGPSSILLALMASGFNGQSFVFHGYLPIDKGERAKKIKAMEQQAQRERQTQIFIETPFRNQQLLAEILRIGKPQTRLCVACNLTTADQQIISQPIRQWKTKNHDFQKKPAIFLLF